MSATARRACVCRSQFLFAVVQWATVPARARSDQGRFQHGAHRGVTSKQVKRLEIIVRRPRRSPRLLVHAGKGAATTNRCARLSARRPAIARGSEARSAAHAIPPP
jgi:hypothetical protein